MTRPSVPLPDEPIVPVRVWLRAHTYKQLTAHAALRQKTVGELLSLLADASLKPIDRPRATPVGRVRHELTPAQRRFIDDPEDSRHGTLNGYSNLKCRCGRCRQASADYSASKNSNPKAATP